MPETSRLSINFPTPLKEELDRITKAYGHNFTATIIEAATIFVRGVEAAENDGDRLGLFKSTPEKPPREIISPIIFQAGLHARRKRETSPEE